MGRRGPLPKDPEALLGHRARAQRQRAEPAAPSGPRIPAARAEWRPETRAAWRAFWRSEMAGVTAAVDLPAIHRLFAMYDQHARAMEVVGKALVVKGSTGQIRANPLADLALKLEGSIGRLEGELGLTPAARQRMGIRLVQPVRQPAVAPETRPSRYAHLREVAS
jgi:P27 family predicted phage terminase small subunit